MQGPEVSSSGADAALRLLAGKPSMTLPDTTPALVAASHNRASRSELRGTSSQTPPVEKALGTSARPEDTHMTSSATAATVVPASRRSGLRGKTGAGKGQGNDGRRGCSMCSFAAGGCERCCPVASPACRSKQSANLVTRQVPPQCSPFLSVIELMSMAEQTHEDGRDSRGGGVDGGCGGERQDTRINPAAEALVSLAGPSAPQHHKTHGQQHQSPKDEGPASQPEVEEKRENKKKQAADEDAGSHRSTLPMEAAVSPPQSPNVSHVANSYGSEGAAGGPGAAEAFTSPASTCVKLVSDPVARVPQHQPSVQPPAFKPSPSPIAKGLQPTGSTAHPQKGSGNKRGGVHAGEDAEAPMDAGGVSTIAKSDRTSAAALPPTPQPSGVDAQTAVRKPKVAKLTLATANPLHEPIQTPVAQNPQPKTAASGQKKAKPIRTTPSGQPAPIPPNITKGGNSNPSSTQHPPLPPEGRTAHLSTPQAGRAADVAESGEFVSWVVLPHAPVVYNIALRYSPSFNQ